ncbi:hypothetical protein MMC17_004529 [Xylographa soralifera]|nr:hypothetical protein [Xylographa soralifera]
MENPVAEIPHIIHLLTQTPPSTQRATIERYFTADASFTHPFCRTGSFNGSRWLIWNVYRWYKIMSPRIDIAVDSVAYDAQALRLYVSLHQVFRIWAIPGMRAPVQLVTVLQLVAAPKSRAHAPRYLIAAQNDLYQVDEFVKFFSLLRVVWLLVLGWQFVATGLCVLGAGLLSPVSWVEENVVGGNRERGVREVVLGGGGEWVGKERRVTNGGEEGVDGVGVGAEGGE